MRHTDDSGITHRSAKPLHILVLCIYFIIVLLAALYSFKRPAYNWDMLGYMALTLKIENPDIISVHDITYKKAKLEVPNWTYDHTLADSSSGFRKRMKENPVAFNNQLAFYVIKPLYIGLVYLFYKAGFSLSASTVMPSVVCFVMMSMLLLYWLTCYLNIYFASLLSLLVMLSAPVLAVAKLSTPDALSGLFLLLVFWFVLKNQNALLMILCMGISIFIRLDNIITCFIILSLTTFAPQSPLKISMGKYLCVLILFAFCYFLISYRAMSYGWSIYFYSTFAHYLTSTSYEAQSAIHLKDYSFLMYSNIIHGFYFSNVIFLFLILSLLFLHPGRAKLTEINFDQLFALCLFLIFIIRFILFPDISDRAYTAFYLVSMILLIKKYQPKSDPKI